MHIRILVFDGANEIDFVGPLEVFRRAAKLAEGIDVRLATLDPCEQVIAAYGLQIVPDGVLDGPTDLLVVPGGGWASRSPVGIRQQIEHSALTQQIAKLHSQGTVVAGVCTGTMALAAAGLLDGRPAVTHHAALPDLAATAAQVVVARVVDDGDVVTCGGVSSSIDLALHLVQRFFGQQIADLIASGMEYSRNTDAVVRKS